MHIRLEFLTKHVGIGINIYTIVQHNATCIALKLFIEIILYDL